MSTEPAGNISATTVRIPKGTAMPSRLEAVVMTDAFPAQRATLTGLARESGRDHAPRSLIGWRSGLRRGERQRALRCTGARSLRRSGAQLHRRDLLRAGGVDVFELDACPWLLGQHQRREVCG